MRPLQWQLNAHSSPALDDRDVVGASLGVNLGEVHTPEEEHSGGSTRSPRPVPSHRVVSSSSGIRRYLRGVQSS